MRYLVALSASCVLACPSQKSVVPSFTFSAMIVTTLSPEMINGRNDRLCGQIGVMPITSTLGLMIGPAGGHVVGGRPAGGGDDDAVTEISDLAFAVGPHGQLHHVKRMPGGHHRIVHGRRPESAVIQHMFATRVQIAMYFDADHRHIQHLAVRVLQPTFDQIVKPADGIPPA